MDRRASARTRVSLLDRLKASSADPAAWAEFVESYSPKIYGWCRKWKLQTADANEVTQIVLTKLVQEMNTFCYDESGSFRAWLKTVTNNAYKDYIESQRRPGRQGTGDSDTIRVLENVEARHDLEQRLAEMFDVELLDMAADRVRSQVPPNKWRAYWLLTHEDLSGRDVAERLSMRRADVYLAKSDVQRMIAEEVARLQKGNSGW